MDWCCIYKGLSVAIACTANAPSVLQNITFCQVAMDDEDDNDESERGINSNDEDLLMIMMVTHLQRWLIIMNLHAVRKMMVTMTVMKAIQMRVIKAIKNHFMTKWLGITFFILMSVRGKKELLF